MDGHLEWWVLAGNLAGRTIAACPTSKQNYAARVIPGKQHLA